MRLTRREFGFLMAAANARPSALEDLGAYLKGLVDAKVVPGVKVAAVHQGKPFAALYVGTYCDQHRRDNPCEAKAVHSLASVSKMIGNTVVVMAWQDGLIDLDAPVAKYVPEFAAHGKSAITIRQCLTHTAGIPTAPAGAWVDTEEHWNAILAKVCDMELEWEPGTRTVYHGMNGLLLSAEAVRRQMYTGQMYTSQLHTGKNWNAICRERLFEPLGLSSLTFEMPPPAASVVLLPPPADISQGAAIYRNGFNNPGGGLLGNIEDVLRFLRFHTRGGELEGKRLLTKKYWTEMHTNQFAGKPAPSKDKPGFEPWGLGMMVRDDSGQLGSNWLGSPNPKAPRVFAHAGISTALAFGDPDAELEIAVLLTNVPSPTSQQNEIRRKSVDGIYAALRG
jgi:CubicO group peptidase (beta-lactamase class C family)